MTKKSTKQININIEDLPIRVQIRGKIGEQKDYVLAAGGNKFGASLQAPNISAIRSR